ncbi:MAG TPA: caspase family protein, partial [Polyangia bacterium]
MRAKQTLWTLTCGLVLAAGVAPGSGCATLVPSMTYASGLKTERVPVRVDVEVQADPGIVKVGDGSPERERLRANIGALGQTFRDALLADLRANGPFTPDEAAPQAVLAVRLTSIVVNPPGHVYFLLACALPIAAPVVLLPYLCGAPGQYTDIRIAALAELIDARGHVLERAEVTEERTTWTGAYYNHEVTLGRTAKLVAEALRTRLAARRTAILARLQGQRPPLAQVAVPEALRRTAAPVAAAGPPAASSPARPAAVAPAVPVAAASPAAAAEALVAGAPQPTAYALIIGIGRYRDVPPVPGALDDAQRFRQLARTTLGIPNANVRVLLDEQATKTDIETELDWLKANVRAGGRVYFYFSGHGAPDPSAGSPHLLPYNGKPAALARTGLPLAEVMRALGETPAREVFAFVDSCFSGAGGRSVLPDGARPLVAVKAPAAGKRLALFAAASGAEISGPDASGHAGVFTKYLLEALGQGKADVNGDGQLSLQELLDWIRPRVAAEAKRAHRDQHPTLVLGDGLGR